MLYWRAGRGEGEGEGREGAVTALANLVGYAGMVVPRRER
jgi:hypothetical protein